VSSFTLHAGLVRIAQEQLLNGPTETNHVSRCRSSSSLERPTYFILCAPCLRDRGALALRVLLRLCVDGVRLGAALVDSRPLLHLTLWFLSCCCCYWSGSRLRGKSGCQRVPRPAAGSLLRLSQARSSTRRSCPGSRSFSAKRDPLPEDLASPSFGALADRPSVRGSCSRAPRSAGRLANRAPVWHLDRHSLVPTHAPCRCSSVRPAGRGGPRWLRWPAVRRATRHTPSSH
jgi:hypothetical protein